MAPRQAPYHAHHFVDGDEAGNAISIRTIVRRQAPAARRVESSSHRKSPGVKKTDAAEGEKNRRGRARADS